MNKFLCLAIALLVSVGAAAQASETKQAVAAAVQADPALRALAEANKIPLKNLCFANAQITPTYPGARDCSVAAVCCWGVVAITAATEVDATKSRPCEGLSSEKMYGIPLELAPRLLSLHDETGWVSESPRVKVKRMIVETSKNEGRTVSFHASREHSSGRPWDQIDPLSVGFAVANQQMHRLTPQFARYTEMQQPIRSALRRPSALQPGDTIAFVAPAGALAAIVPHRVERARQELESYGFKVKIYSSVIRTQQQNLEILLSNESVDQETHDASSSPLEFYSSADPQTRAQELMDAFRDPQVKAILCTIGGFTSHELLEYLDFDVIRENPKIFSGFSDITSLHLAFYNQAQLCTFYGPSAICQFGEFPKPLSYTMEYFFKAVQATEPIGSIAPSLQWTDDKTANWITGMDITYEDKMKQNEGYVWLREGSTSGIILGGCLPVLLNLRGTKFYPEFTDSILLLETPDGAAFDKGMSLNDVNMVLGCLRVDGTFAKIRGLVIGRAFAYMDEQVGELQRLVKYHTRGTTFPILYGVDAGHTNPMATIPLGCRASLDSSSTDGAFSILESAVE